MSSFDETEKEFLKHAKKLREIEQLEAKIASGTKLAGNQQQKVIWF